MEDSEERNVQIMKYITDYIARFLNMLVQLINIIYLQWNDANFWHDFRLHGNYGPHDLRQVGHVNRIVFSRLEIIDIQVWVCKSDNSQFKNDHKLQRDRS